MNMRPLLKMLLLTVVTLGFYQLYWYYQTKEEMNARGQHVPSFKRLFAPLMLFFFALLLTLLSHVITGGEKPASGTAANALDGAGALIAAGSILLMIPWTLHWIYQYCKGVAGVTNNMLSAGLSFAAYIVLVISGLGILWPLFIQHFFNKPGVALNPDQSPRSTV